MHHSALFRWFIGFIGGASNFCLQKSRMPTGRIGIFDINIQSQITEDYHFNALMITTKNFLILKQFTTGGHIFLSFHNTSRSPWAWGGSRIFRWGEPKPINGEFGPRSPHLTRSLEICYGFGPNIWTFDPDKSLGCNPRQA